jgi:hypothetical protein
MVIAKSRYASISSYLSTGSIRTDQDGAACTFGRGTQRWLGCRGLQIRVTCPSTKIFPVRSTSTSTTRSSRTVRWIAAVLRGEGVPLKVPICKIATSRF